ncbi:hypothetical protein MLD38_001875 [Melastoma candidum]|uniref:Uncharacterized protein n=1 Tax=Melastoma candidum TaxID=119954 RepID=A0ACB9SIK9_9MYRT|nr:hypothetical protein MLD38_001875 [Melastoma candidum]
MLMLGADCRDASAASLSPPRLSSPFNAGGVPFKDSLFSSPRISNERNRVLQLKREMIDRARSRTDSEKIVACDTVQYAPCNDTPNRKSSVELKKEIATLEFEISRMERYLLSLYRGAFVEHLSTTPNSTDMEVQSKCDARSPSCKVKGELELNSKMETPVKRSLLRSFQSSPAHYWTSSDSQSLSSSFNTRSSRVSRKKSSLGRQSLADHLSPSFTDEHRSAAERLSEDIVRCMSSIYCKLAGPSQPQGHSSSSPRSSLSSSSLLSSHHPRDSWSPSRCEESAVRRICNFREESSQHVSMVEVLKICLDNNSFKFAAATLQKFRSLVRNLESIDPRKLKREEKLAFWINIHNALMMHAYIAYGTASRIRSTALLKAAYNIGGQSMNPYLIQTSILGIRSNQSATWLQALFAPGRKPKTGSTSHAYALDYPEPLVHFALSSGTYSDPPVRTYASMTIFADLKRAKEEYIRANVYINKESRIFLPRILYCFAKDASITIPRLLDVVGECLPQPQRKIVERCSKGRAADKHVHWLPHNSTFRYVLHGEPARAKPAI